MSVIEMLFLSGAVPSISVPKSWQKFYTKSVPKLGDIAEGIIIFYFL